MKGKKFMFPLALAAVFMAFGTSSSFGSQPEVLRGQTSMSDEQKLVPLDSIILSDPALLADSASSTYYMTGTGGKLWKSKDLKMWEGPYAVAMPDTASWMGPNPAIWAAELHKYGNKYYYFATFTNNDLIIEENQEGRIPRRASHILVSDFPDGPYRPVSDADYLPADRPTLDGTFWIDTDGTPFMVFCGEWLHNQNGTIEKIQLSPDLSGTVGSPKVLFRASDSPWSCEKIDGKIQFNRVTDGPWLFRTDTGRLGMIWTSWVLGDYTMGVAYSESGTLDGPWIQMPEPITPPNYGHGMIFKDFQGRNILSAHSHAEVNGRYVRRPNFWEVDLSGDELKIVKKLDEPDLPDDDPRKNAYEGYRLVFAQEFSGDAPSHDVWDFEEGFCRNEEDQWYDADRNIYVQDGVLVIEGRNVESERIPNPKYSPDDNHWPSGIGEHLTWTSGSMRTKGTKDGGYSWLYGIYEVRAKVPQYVGAWPAIWSTGVEHDWPYGGEIDIMEYYGNCIHGNVCWGDGRRWGGHWNSATVHDDQLGEGWGDEFHIWRMVWEPDRIQLWCDDILVNDIDLSTTVNDVPESDFDHGNGCNPFRDVRQTLWLNLALGGLNGGSLEATPRPLRYLIDYARVYQKIGTDGKAAYLVDEVISEPTFSVKDGEE